jgi:hypothetical protein
VLRSTSFVVIVSLDDPALVTVLTAGSTGGVVSLPFRFKSLLTRFIPGWWK